MRLFIAVNFNEEMKKALLNIQQQFRENNIRGNYTKPENLHLTLAFIGEYGDPGHVLDVLSDVDIRPFTLRTDRVGSFGKLWWAGIAVSGELQRLTAQIRRRLADADIPFDRKKFSPHITLIREPDRHTIPEISVPEASMTAEKITLMRSDRGRNGMIYTALGGTGYVR